MSEAPLFGAFAPRRGIAEAAEEGLPDDLVEVGAILQAYGVRGQIKVAPHAQGGDALLAARTWWLDVRGQTLRVGPVRARLHSGTVAAGWPGCEDRDAAEALKGARVRVRRSDFPALPEGEYYWVDLIGLTVSNPQGDVLGTVADLIDNGAHSVLRVTDGEAGEAVERLIPFVGAYVLEVDVPARRLLVDWQRDY